MRRHQDRRLSFSLNSIIGLCETAQPYHVLHDASSVWNGRTKRPLQWVDLAEGRLTPRSPVAHARIGLV